MHLRHSLLLTSLFLIGCATSDSARTSAAASLWMPPVENKMQEDHLPTPFSPAELRAGVPGGCVLRFKMEGATNPILTMEMAFHDGDEAGTEFEITMKDESGQAAAPPQRSRADWTELQSHASFPAASTQLSREEHRFPLGSAECWLYTVSQQDGDALVISRYWFDPSRPGPPVDLTETRNGQLTSRMVLVGEEGR